MSSSDEEKADTHISGNPEVVIVRFGGEIGIKGKWTRRHYEKQVLENIKNYLTYHTIPYTKIVYTHGRSYIQLENARKVALKLTQIFGISSVSPALHTSSEMQEMTRKTVETAQALLKTNDTFAVRCRRVGVHPYTSMDICREMGTQIQTKLKHRNLQVNLTKPHVTINLEIRSDDLFIFTETFQGVDGFPIGAQPKVVCLLSGGIDSPVASWLTMKRGCPIVPTYFQNSPYVDKAAANQAIKMASKLFEWSIGFSRRMYLIPHGKNLQIIQKQSPTKLTCILCKRVMYRIAERIAEFERAEGIITGESIGEQASQTLHNLRVLNEAASNYPIHRPLLGFNKCETTELAKQIGTYQIAAEKSYGCRAAPNSPSTKANLQRVKEAEAQLNIEDMVNEAIEQAKIITIK